MGDLLWLRLSDLALGAPARLRLLLLVVVVLAVRRARQGRLGRLVRRVVVLVCNWVVLKLRLVLGVGVVVEVRILIHLLHVLLWGLVLLVHVHLFHLGGQLGLLLVLRRLLLHPLLRKSELLKHVLVVQDGVRELVLEAVSVEELVNAGGELGHAEDLVDRRPHRWVLLQKLLNDSASGAAEVRGQWRVLTLDNLLSKLMQGARVEWWLQGSHLIQKHAKRPNIRLKAISFLADNLWRQVVWGTNHRLGTRAGVGQHAGNAEITQLDDSTLRHKDILGLQISVQNFLIVGVFDGETDLGEPVQNLLFREILGAS